MEKKINSDLKDFLKGIGVFILYFFGSALIYDFISLFGIDFKSLNNLLQQLYLIVCETLLTLIIVYIYREDFIPNLKYFLKNIKTYFKKYFKYWFLIVGLMSLSNMIVTSFTTTDIAQNQQEIINSLNKSPMYTLFLTIFIAPILEELVYRLSFRKMFKHTNFLFIFFSGLFFGMMHVLGTIETLTDLLFIIPYSIPGFIFAYIYTRSKNIFTPISLHFIHNTVMMILQIIIIII